MEVQRVVIFDLITGIVVKDWYCSFLNGKTVHLDFSRFGWSIDTVSILRDSRPRLPLIMDIELDYKLKMLKAIIKMY